MSLIPWSTLWVYIATMDGEHKAQTTAEAEKAILSLPEEERIKALENAPEEIKAKFSPQDLMPFTAEEWEAAETRWNELKESK